MKTKKTIDELSYKEFTEQITTPIKKLIRECEEQLESVTETLQKHKNFIEDVKSRGGESEIKEICLEVNKIGEEYKDFLISAINDLEDLFK